MTRAWLTVLLVLASAGCGRNAIFELELELPAQPSGAMRFVVVEASETQDFGAPWTDAEPVELGPLAAGCARPEPPPPCVDRALDPECSRVVSVVSGGGSMGPLRLRVRFCESPGCTLDGEASAPQAQVTVARAFYEARYTQARVCLDEVPAGATPVDVARCDVRCREGTAAMQCRADGTHFCEEPAN